MPIRRLYNVGDVVHTSYRRWKTSCVLGETWCSFDKLIEKPFLFIWCCYYHCGNFVGTASFVGNQVFCSCWHEVFWWNFQRMNIVMCVHCPAVMCLPKAELQVDRRLRFHRWNICGKVQNYKGISFTTHIEPSEGFKSVKSDKI